MVRQLGLRAQATNFGICVSKELLRSSFGLYTTGFGSVEGAGYTFMRFRFTGFGRGDEIEGCFGFGI